MISEYCDIKSEALQEYGMSMSELSGRLKLSPENHQHNPYRGRLLLPA